MGRQLAVRWRLTLPLLLPVTGGLAYLYAFGAPARLLAINAGALLIAIMWVHWGRLFAAPKIMSGIAVALVLCLFLPLATGPDLGGVTRWLPAGPVMLHAGPLLLPLLVVLAARDARLGPLLLGAAAAALAAQPDAASLMALAVGSFAVAAMSRRFAFALVGATAATLAVLTLGAGSLEPQVYTEGVLAHVGERSVAGAIGLGLLLFCGPLSQLVIPYRRRCIEGYALAAMLVGFAVMAMIAPFPFPLIGYGASPILGFGLALGAIATRLGTLERFQGNS